jgi:hypothetical protein
MGDEVVLHYTMPMTPKGLIEEGLSLMLSVAVVGGTGRLA